MKCPRCGGKSRVSDVRPIGQNLRRTRQCQSCSHAFGTVELLRPRISGSRSAPAIETATGGAFSVFGWRQRLGLSIAAAARALGVSPGTIRDMEEGRSEVSRRTVLACMYLEEQTLCLKAS